MAQRHHIEARVFEGGKTPPVVMIKTSKRLYHSFLKTLMLVATFAGFSAQAANWYVNAAVGSSGNGQSWSTAWKDPGSVNWSSVQPGDTIWIAGGNYSAGFSPAKNGTAANWIYIKRATSADTAATSATGWNSSYDSQAVISDGNGFSFGTANMGSYLYVDGRSTNGIRLQFPGSSWSHGSVFFSAGGMHDIVFTNIDMAGPGGATAYNFQGDCSVIGMRTSIGGGGSVYNVTVASSSLHGGPNLVYNLGANYNFTFDKCKFYDNGSANSDIHANMIYTSGGNYNWTFKFCEFYNWQVEGINLYQQTSHPHYFYGCVFRDPMDSSARCFWLASESGSPTGPIYLYNNTFVGVNITLNESRASMAASGSQARNNIYWNSSFYSGSSITDSDYNFSSGSTAGANSITSGSNPFVNEAGNDFRIVATVGAKYPKDKGATLSSPYNIGPAGSARVTDGLWDMGAHENGATAVSLSVNAGTDASITLPSSTVTLTGSVFNPTSGVPILSWTVVSGPASVSFGNAAASTTTATFTTAGTYTLRLTATVAPVTVSDTVVVVVNPAPPVLGLNFSATNTIVTSPFTITGNYISQTVDTDVTSGGRVAYRFMVTNSGEYTVTADVVAPHTGANSVFVNIDAEPTDPVMIWDIPVTTTTGNRTVAWRGNGTDIASQFSPKTFTLSAGQHELIVRGREPGVQLVRFILLKVSALPAPPSNLQVVSFSP